jgi:hypothetical protein
VPDLDQDEDDPICDKRCQGREELCQHLSAMNIWSVHHSSSDQNDKAKTFCGRFGDFFGILFTGGRRRMGASGTKTIELGK